MKQPLINIDKKNDKQIVTESTTVKEKRTT
jgi:hypothetical protein